MPPAKNITGLRSGRLVAQHYAGYANPSGSRYWYCLCDCKRATGHPGFKNVTVTDLQINNVQSCGCLFAETRTGRPARTEWNVAGRWLTIPEMLADPRCIVTQDLLHSRLYQGVDPLLAMTQKTLRQMIPINGQSFTQTQVSSQSGVPIKQLNQRIWRDNLTIEQAAIPGDRREVLVSAWGERKNIKDWFDDPRCAVKDYATLTYRLRVLEINPEEAITQPDNLHALYVEAWGERKMITDWVKDSRCKVNYNTLFQRLRLCIWLTLEEAMTIEGDLKAAVSYQEVKAKRKWFLATLTINQIASLMEPL